MKKLFSSISSVLHFQMTCMASEAMHSKETNSTFCTVNNKIIKPSFNFEGGGSLTYHFVYDMIG